MKEYVTVSAIEPKHVDQVLATFDNALATQSNLSRLAYERDKFFTDIEYRGFGLDLSKPKTQNEWVAIMKVCEKLKAFDYMYYNNPIIEEQQTFKDRWVQKILDILQ